MSAGFSNISPIATRPGRRWRSRTLTTFWWTSPSACDCRRYCWKRSLIQPVSAGDGADFRRACRFGHFAGATTVRTPAPVTTMGGRAAPFACGRHVDRSWSSRLRSSSVDEHLWARRRRDDPTAIRRYRLGRWYHPGDAAKDRRGLHASSVASGRRGAGEVPARWSATEHSDPARLHQDDDAVRATELLVGDPPYPRQACQGRGPERALSWQPCAAFLERGASSRSRDTASSAFRSFRSPGFGVDFRLCPDRH